MEALPTGAYAVMLSLVALALAIAMLIRCVGAIRFHARRNRAPSSKRPT
jgi:hypothetical protein